MKIPADSRFQYAPGDAQRAYYEKTARDYDSQHVSEDDEHSEALEFVAFYVKQLGLKTLLDTGCGTGRAHRFFRARIPELSVTGNDPSRALLRVAIEQHGVPESSLIEAETLSLDFPPASFDAVMSLAVLHHVPNPTAVITRMLDLSRQAIFISDANYLGQGSAMARVLKWGLTEARVWPLVKYVQQGFKGWSYDEGDGVHYSFSVFNHLPLIRKHCKKVLIVPIGPAAQKGLELAKFQAPLALVCGFK